MEDDNNWHYRSPTRDELLASKKSLKYKHEKSLFKNTI